MARWRFAFLTLTLSVAAGCPNQTPPSAPTPGGATAASPPASSPATTTQSEAERRESERLARMAMQLDPRSDPFYTEGEDPQARDPLADLAMEGPLLGQFEDFSDRGSVGTRSYKGGRLETIVLDGRSKQLTYDAKGQEVFKVTTDDGRISCRLRVLPGSVWEREFGATIDGLTAQRQRVLLFDTKTRVPTRFGTDNFTWAFEWKEGRVSAEHGPRGSRSYGYDTLGRLASWSDQTGKGVSLSREGAATHHTLADGRAFTLVQDAEGALREARQDGERYGFSYEGGDLRQASSPLATLDYTHQGTRRSVSSPWGKSLTQLEGSSRRARWIETPAGTFRFAYEGGKRSQLSYPNGVVARYSYREGRDLLRLESSALDLARRYDERGRLVEERRDRSETPSSYGYNGFGSLNRVTEAGQTKTYAYDEATNRYVQELSPNQQIVDEPWSTLALRRRVLQEKAQGASTWKIKEVLRTYRSDGAGRLLEIKPASGASDHFAYDGAGRLEEAQRAGGPKVRYAYDPLGRISSRTQGTGDQAQVTRYVYDGPRLLAELGPGKALRVYAHGPDLDEPLAYRDGEGPWVFLHGDERGTVLAYSNSEGQRVDAVRFSPFGVLLDAPEVSRPLFFAGHRYDPETRLVLARARAYEPELNRFLGPDPAGVRDGINPFLYAQGNPLSFVDPLGLWAVPSTVRSHYGTLSPRAQLLLLQGVNGMRMSPNPKAPLMTLFKRYHPDVQLTTEGAEGETRTGRGPGADLVERLAQAETYEEAQELMASPLAEAAREDLSGYQYKMLQGVAGLEDDEARGVDSELLRELLAPTPQEEAAGMRIARKADLTMQFLDKYLGVKAPELLRDAASTLVSQAGQIKRREVLGTDAAHLARLSDVEFAEAMEAIDDFARPRNLSAAVAKLAAAPRPTITLSTFVKLAERSKRYSSAPDERRAYVRARRKQGKLWRQHAADLASPAALKNAVRDADLESRQKLFDKLAREDREAAQEVRQTEIALRQALVRPLGYAEAYRRIRGDHSLFEGKNTAALLRESMPYGEEEALTADVSKFTRLSAEIKESKRPNYSERMGALNEAIAKEAAKRRAISQAKTNKLAANARAKAKAKKRRGRRRGITRRGERVAPRPSGVSMAAAEPARRSRARKSGARKSGARKSGNSRGSARKSGNSRGSARSKDKTNRGRGSSRGARTTGLAGALRY